MKYYVFGSNGMMGKYFCSEAKDKAVPLTRKDYDILKNDKSLIENVLRKSGIEEGDIIVNCAGAIKQRDFSLKDYVVINSLFPHQLQDVAETLGCRLVHITTDCVYNGEKGFRCETDPHTCTDWYGKSKSLGEPGDSCCIRTSIIGLGSTGSVSLLDWFLNQKGNDQVNGYSDHLWNGVTCLELSKYILHLKNDLWKGTRHVYSDTVSKYELLKLFDHSFRTCKNLIKTNSNTPCDRTLSSIYNPKIENPISQQIKDLKEHYENSISR